MCLNQTLLHLLLQVLQSIALSLIDLLVCGLHLARAELTNGQRMIFGIFHAIVYLFQVCFRCEGGCALDPLRWPYGAVLRRSRVRQRITIVILSLQSALLAGSGSLKRCLLITMFVRPRIIVLSLALGDHLTQHGLVETSEFARYLPTRWPAVGLRLVKTQVNRILGLN